MERSTYDFPTTSFQMFHHSEVSYVTHQAGKGSSTLQNYGFSLFSKTAHHAVLATMHANQSVDLSGMQDTSRTMQQYIKNCDINICFVCLLNSQPTVSIV